MNRRKFIIGAAGTALGGSALVGSGAFSSVEADRGVEVAVADDSAAFLALEPGEENGEYARETGGTLELSFDGDADVAGNGFNTDATTLIGDIFRIRNQGTQDVMVNLTAPEDFPDQKFAEPPGPVAFAETGDSLSFDPEEAVIIFSLGDDPGPPFSTETEELEPGESVRVSASFFVSEIDSLDELDEFAIEISAESTD